MDYTAYLWWFGGWFIPKNRILVGLYDLFVICFNILPKNRTLKGTLVIHHDMLVVFADKVDAPVMFAGLWTSALGCASTINHRKPVYKFITYNIFVNVYKVVGFEEYLEL